MWYLVCGVIASLLIALYSKKLKSNIVYIITSLFLPTIGISLWYSNVRSKSKDRVWTLTKAFAVSHSIMCIIWLLSLDIFNYEFLNAFYKQSEIFNDGISIVSGSMLIVIMWGLGLFFALVLGLISKEVKLQS